MPGITEEQVYIFNVVGGEIGVAEITRFLRDGIYAGESPPHRYVLKPGDDVSGRPQTVRNVAEAVWSIE